MDQNPPKESRPPINLRIKFRSESVEQFIERYAVDVSRGGIFIRTREPLAVGTQLKLDFQFQNGSALMAGDGTVVWIREFDANRTSVPPGMGVRFDKLTPESQAVLEQLLIEKAKRERSGIPGSGSQGAGGIAVRRPSSTFSVLDAQAGAASAAPANTGTATSSAAGAAQSGPLSPLAAVAAHAAAKGAEPTQKTEEPAAYRPLGTARNPFSAIVAPEVPGSNSATPSSDSSDGSEDSAAPFDDINDEPTQIAGRLPSFLLSDDDATVANAQAPGRADTAADKTGTGAAPAAAEKGSSSKAPNKDGKDKDAGASGKGSAAVAARAALPGMGRGPSAESGKRGSDDGLSSDDAASASPAGDVKSASGGEAIAPADAAKGAKGTTTAPSRGAAIAETASAIEGKSDKRRSGAVLVAASVVVLGASAIFLFRFFSSQSTQTGQSTASTVRNTETISAGPSPSPTPVGETQPAPAAGNAPGPDAPTRVPSSGGEGAPAAAPPSAAEAAAHPSVPGTAAEPEANSPSLTAPLVADAPEASSRKLTKRKPARSTRDTASATPVGESKSGESKSGEAKSGEAKSGETKSGESKSGEIKSGEVPSVASPGATAAPVVAGAVAPSGTPSAPGAAAAKPEDKPAATDAEVPGHQIRVTSKPDGADVTLDGQTVGKTPFMVGIADLTAPHIIAVRKDGFEPFEQMISATSAWSRPKPTKGKPTLQILKITVKLKPVAGAEARPATQPEPATLDSANKGQPAKAGVPAKPAGADSPLAPTEVRPAAESK